MKLPLMWIEELLDPAAKALLRARIGDSVPLPDEQRAIAALWTESGTKVERIGPVTQSLAGVRVGSVMEAEKHPNADRLRVTKVRIGADVLSIVCGAPNVAAGQKVAVATVGTVLPGDRKIERAKIRGVESNGMICSAIELGLGAESDGILVLPADAPEGEAFEKYAGLSEPVVEFEITYNRPDCLSAIGVARELAVALGGGSAVLPKPTVVESGPSASHGLRVELPDASLCTHYAARIVDGITVGPSPEWMKRRLERSGVRSINNVVDVTNYVLLELGQPLHAFDLSAVRGGLIQVRRAKDGEKLKTLDGVDRTLSVRHVVIADAERPVALAGAMGGEEESISPATKSVLLESACFVPSAIRESARAAGIRSEASVRFSGGTDPAMVQVAADRACQLLVELAGGSVRPGTVESKHPVPSGAPVSLRAKRLADFLGAPVELSEARKTLESLGFTLSAGPDALQATPPSYRRDVTEEADLIEEVARFRVAGGQRGYNTIPELLPPPAETPPVEPLRRFEQAARRLLTAAGAFEARTYSLVSSRGLPKDGTIPGGRVVRIENFLTEDMDCLRWSLVPGLLSSAAYNVRHGKRGVSLFEIGRVFADKGVPDPLQMERRHVAWVVCGGAESRHWIASGRDRGFFDAKGLVELVIEGLGVADLSFRPVAAAPGGIGEPGRCAEVLDTAGPIGWMGEISHSVCKELDLPPGTAAAELDFEALVRLGHLEPKAPSLARFPAARRDIALVLDQTEPAEKLRTLARTSAGPMLREAEIFDVYSGAPLPTGKRSLAIALTFQSAERSLTDDEIAVAVDNVVRTAKQELGAELRT